MPREAFADILSTIFGGAEGKGETGAQKNFPTVTKLIKDTLKQVYGPDILKNNTLSDLSDLNIQAKGNLAEALPAKPKTTEDAMATFNSAWAAADGGSFDAPKLDAQGRPLLKGFGEPSSDDLLRATDKRLADANDDQYYGLSKSEMAEINAQFPSGNIATKPKSYNEALAEINAQWADVANGGTGALGSVGGSLGGPADTGKGSGSGEKGFADVVSELKEIKAAVKDSSIIEKGIEKGVRSALQTEFS